MNDPGFENAKDAAFHLQQMLVSRWCSDTSVSLPNTDSVYVLRPTPNSWRIMWEDGPDGWALNVADGLSIAGRALDTKNKLPADYGLPPDDDEPLRIEAHNPYTLDIHNE